MNCLFIYLGHALAGPRSWVVVIKPKELTFIVRVNVTPTIAMGSLVLTKLLKSLQLQVHLLNQLSTRRLHSLMV